MNKQKMAYQNSYASDINLQAHSRQSIKGLFTFYREQQEAQQIKKKQKYENQMKQKHLRILRIRTQQKTDDQQMGREIKREKKNKSKTKSSNKSKSLEGKIKKKKKRSQKIIKQLDTSKNSGQNYQDMNNSMEDQEKQEGPYEKFLKRIKQYKQQRSHKTSLSAIHEQTSENVSNVEDKREKFYKLVYPKNSVDQQSKINKFRYNIEKKIEYHLNQKHVVTKGQDIVQKKKIIIDDIFEKRSQPRIKKSLANRKRLFTQLPFQQKNNPNIYVKNNFYSPQRRNMIQNLCSEGLNDPISPPTSTRINHPTEEQEINKLRSSQNLKPEKRNLSQSLKLPHIKNVRLSKELGKIQEIVSRQTSPIYKYDTNKSKKYQKKPIKSHSQGKIKVKKKQRESKDLIKKIEKQMIGQEGGKCYVALIDLSKSDQKDDGQGQWNEKKKILFKKLGLKM